MIAQAAVQYQSVGEGRRAHCQFCAGLGSDEYFETVTTSLGTTYRIPKSHVTCKQSVLSLSLDEPARPKRRGRKTRSDP